LSGEEQDSDSTSAPRGAETAENLLEAVQATDEGDDEDSYDEMSVALHTATLQSTAPARATELGALDELIDAIRKLHHDSKAQQLLAAIARVLEIPDEKVLVFTQFLETQRYLAETLRSKGYTVEIFNGTMPVAEKDAAVERFRENAQVLISTEAGGEGRNFQFCHVMFNYDLPWNPMRIEQRIGRLDRIGQQRAIHIYNFAAVGTIEERILDVLQHRIKLFEETIGGLDPILGQFERDLERLIMEERSNYGQALVDFGVDWEQRVAEARRMDERLRDFVMDLRSFRRDEADRLLSRARPVTHTHLRDFVHDFLAMYPTAEFEERNDGTVLIEVPQRFIEHAGPKILDGYVGTFDPELALRRESLEFFAIGHPLVDAILDLCQATHFGGLTPLRVVNSPEDGGFWGIQCNFIVDYAGVRKYPRFIPIVVGFDGGDSEGRSARISGARTVPGAHVNLPNGWQDAVAQAIRQSETLLIEHIEREIPVLEERNRADHALLRTRTQKLYEFRITRARERLNENSAMVERFRRSRDPGERRVLPIWERRVRDETLNMERLQLERDEELQSLEIRQRIEYDFAPVNAAIVHVLPPGSAS
jgi:hypothetical protein